MSASSLSTAPAAAASSSTICNKFSSHPQTQLSTCFPSKPKYPKPLKLKTQNPNTLLPFSFLSFLPNARCFSGGFDSFPASEDEEDQEADNPLEEEEEDEEEEKVTDSSGGEEGRLYVGNLPYSMTSSQVAEAFGEAGNVVNVQIVYDKVTDRSRGFAFVTMGSKQEAEEAIRMFDGSQIGGRTVKVNFPEVPRGGEREVMGPRIRDSYRSFIDTPHKIYAGNLGWSLTSQGLRDAFADQPGLLSAKVIYDRGSGRSRGFGFVSFESAEDVQSALNSMNGMEVEGRPLRLNLAAERAPTSLPQAAEGDAEEKLENSELLSSIST